MARNLNDMIKVGDFLRVEQQVVCYEAGEIAHIENVMIGETRERKNTYLEREERTTESETITENEQERDTQTSERYAMQRESQKIMNQDMNFDVSLSLSGQAGPVTIVANTGFSMSQSTTQTDKTVSDYAKTVVERARNRTFQRTRSYEKLTVIKQWEDINTHSFKNEPLAGEDKSNNIGIYRWVDKKYENKLLNYGRRLMLNVMIPDPANWHRQAATYTPSDGGLLIMPEKPTFKVTDVTESTFEQYAAIYGVSGIKGPERIKNIATSYAYNGTETEDVGSGGNNFKQIKATVSRTETDNKNILVADGYVAIEAHVDIKVTDATYANSKSNLQIYVGDKNFDAMATQWWTAQTASFSKEISGSVPVSIMGYIAAAYYVHVIVKCQMTPTAFAEWQLNTYNTIMEAYSRQLAEYERKLEALKQTSNQQYGNNPTKNRLIEQQELKKGAINVLSDSPEFFTMFNETYKKGEYSFIQNNLGGLFSGVAHFFENAFEWELMSYTFYPYYWQFGTFSSPPLKYKVAEGRWAKVYSIRDNDDVYEKFLQAGYANVIVSVRPGYELMVLNYLENGILLNQDFVSKVPVVDNAKSDITDSKAPTVDDPVEVSKWYTKTPTNLVILQTSAQGAPGVGLPCWESEDKRRNPDKFTLDDQFGAIG